jgi:hypothetical protein
LAFDIGLKFGLLLSLKILDQTHFKELEDLETFFVQNIKNEGVVLWKRS